MVHKPRVVLFRHAPVDYDSRIKRIATTLHRGGFEPVIISVEAADGESGEFVLGGHTRVIRVPLKAWPAESGQAATPNPQHERMGRLRRQRSAYASRIKGPDVASGKAALRWVLTNGKLGVVHAMNLGASAREAARKLRARFEAPTDPFEPMDLATNLPVAHNLVYTLHDLLVELNPDVLHAHNPLALPAALAAARTLREQGGDVKLSYDVREDFAGLPEKEIGNPKAHQTLLDVEREFMRHVDYVFTVTESHAQLMKDKYHLPELPDTFVNLSVFQPMTGDVTVREAAGLGEDTPLVVYAGIMSWARGMEALIESMKYMDPAVHLAIVSVPNPHPMRPKLDPMAEEHGVADRIHYLDPVNQAHLSYYLHGADIAVHPLPGGSPNHDRTLPNKLFEYLHAELPLASSDARTMAAFVREHGMGVVFRSNDARDMAEKMTQLLADPTPQEHLHALAEEFSWQSNEQGIIDAFSRLTGYRGTTPEGEFGSTEVSPA